MGMMGWTHESQKNTWMPNIIMYKSNSSDKAKTKCKAPIDDPQNGDPWKTTERPKIYKVFQQSPRSVK